MAGEIEARLKALDLVLPEVPAPSADYVSYLHLNGQLFVSGQLPLKDGRLAVTGKLGADVDLDQGQDAARLCALNILAQAKAALRDLDRIVQCCASTALSTRLPGFADHPKVINGASELMVEVLGQQGAPYPHRRRLRQPAAQRRRRDRCHFRDRLGPAGSERLPWPSFIG